MSSPEFHQTPMGHRFYDVTAPSLVRELARLNENLERLLAVVERDHKGEEGTCDAKAGKAE